MRVVVVEAGAVAKNQIALNLAEGQRALGILGEIVGFVAVLKKLLDAKSARIAVRILATIVPTHPNTGSGSTANQRDRFRDDIHALGILASYPDLGFGAELDVHDVDFRGSFRAQLCRCVSTPDTPVAQA